MAGRKTKYSDEFAAELCRKIASGRSLSAILREDQDQPDMSTVFDWLNDNQLFAEKYARAVSIRSELHAESIIDISDDPLIEADHKRIMVDSRKWIAARMLPKKYGDKLDVNQSGSVTINVVTGVPEPDK